MRRLNNSQASQIRVEIAQRLADIRQQSEHPTDVQLALKEIKEIVGSEPFHMWFNGVHKLRSAGKQKEYETVIFDKLAEVTKTNKESEQ